jgi:hypothetical protein
MRRLSVHGKSPETAASTTSRSSEGGSSFGDRHTTLSTKKVLIVYYQVHSMARAMSAVKLRSIVTSEGSLVLGAGEAAGVTKYTL